MLANARGPLGIQVLASSDGSSYTSVYDPNIERDNRWNLQFIYIPQFKGSPTASIRVVPFWDSSAAASGFLALDNIAIEAQPIPAPLSAVVLSLAVCARRRRR